MRKEITNHRQKNHFNKIKNKLLQKKVALLNSKFQYTSLDLADKCVEIEKLQNVNGRMFQDIKRLSNNIIEYDYYNNMYKWMVGILTIASCLLAGGNICLLNETCTEYIL